MKVQDLFHIPPKGPLHGYVVLEIGGHVSGPIAGSELARKGALVVKLELDKTGDPARAYMSPAVFNSFNAAKVSCAIDKSKPTDNILYRDLLCCAAVIIDNRSPLAKERDTVLQSFLKMPMKNRTVIYCSIVGYDSNQHKDLPALDVAIQATSGIAATNAAIPNQPLKVGFVVVDVTTGLQAASTIKDHLLAVQRGLVLPASDNQVIMIEQSMLKTASVFLTGHILHTHQTGQNIQRQGNRDAFIAPFSFYKTKDGQIALAAITNAQFESLCKHVLQQPELAKVYPTNADRLSSVEQVDGMISLTLEGKTTAEWVALCTQYQIVCSPIYSVKQMLEFYGNMVLSHTQSNQPIIADSHISSAFPPVPLADAPKLNEHRQIIEQLASPFMQFTTLQKELTLNFERKKTIATLPAANNDGNNNTNTQRAKL